MKFMVGQFILDHFKIVDNWYWSPTLVQWWYFYGRYCRMKDKSISFPHIWNIHRVQSLNIEGVKTNGKCLWIHCTIHHLNMLQFFIIWLILVCFCVFWVYWLQIFMLNFIDFVCSCNTFCHIFAWTFVIGF